MVVGPVVALDPPVDLLDAEPACVDRLAVVEGAPDQRLAELGLTARQVFVRPRPAFDQLEVNKRLYMDEKTLEKTAGFAALQADLASLVDALLEHVGQARRSH